MQKNFKSLCWYKYNVRMSRMLGKWRVQYVCLYNLPIAMWQNFLMFVLKWSISNLLRRCTCKMHLLLFFVNQCLVGSVAVIWGWDWQSIPWLIIIILLREIVSELAQLLHLQHLNKSCKIPSFFCCIVNH